MGKVNRPAMDPKLPFTKMSRCGSPEIRCPIRFMPRLDSTISIDGPVRATNAWIIRSRLATFLLTSRDTRTSTNTERGRNRQTMVRFGNPPASPLGGLLTDSVTGFGFLRGDGLGLKTSLGATHHFTMDVGCIGAAHGDGHRARSMCVRITHPHSWPGSAGQAGALA